MIVHNVYLNCVHFQGEIPESFGSLNKLSKLLLDHNRFNGELECIPWPLSTVTYKDLYTFDCFHKLFFKKRDLDFSLCTLLSGVLVVRPHVICLYKLFVGLTALSFSDICNSISR